MVLAKSHTLTTHHASNGRRKKAHPLLFSHLGFSAAGDSLTIYLGVKAVCVYA